MHFDGSLFALIFHLSAFQTSDLVEHFLWEDRCKVGRSEESAGNSRHACERILSSHTGSLAENNNMRSRMIPITWIEDLGLREK